MRLPNLAIGRLPHASLDASHGVVSPELSPLAGGPTLRLRRQALHPRNRVRRGLQLCLPGAPAKVSSINTRSRTARLRELLLPLSDRSGPGEPRLMAIARAEARRESRPTA